ncbi:MAG: DUF5675 family protein [Balneola sp.]
MGNSDTYTSVLMRLRDNGNATYGMLSVYKNGKSALDIVTLEPSSFFNLPFISCIPCGKYTIVKRYSERFGWHLHIKDVDGRTLILIHAGNLYKDTEGCVVVGSRFGYANSDHVIDVIESKNTLAKLIDLLPEESEIEIVEHEEMQKWSKAS